MGLFVVCIFIISLVAIIIMVVFDIESKKSFIFFFALFIISSVVGIGLLMHYENQEAAACEKAGGILTQSKCIDKKVFIDYKKFLE